MKRQLCILLIFNIGFVLTAMSQTSNPNFLFKEYQEAKIFFTGGVVSNEKINYNVKDKDLYYIDRSDGDEKIVTNPENIRVIKIEDRTFRLVKGSLQEVLPFHYKPFNY